MTGFHLPRLGQRAEEQGAEAATGLVPPVSDFSYVDAGAHTANFTDLSDDPDGTIVSHHWDFGDSATKPTANFTFVPDGLTVRFTDTSTDVGAGTIVSWLWNFGDGTTATVQHPIHVYQAAGNYPVRLTVTDNDGNSSTIEKQGRADVPVSGTGRAWGPFGLWSGTTSRQANTDVFTGAQQYVSAVSTPRIDGLIANARLVGKKVCLMMTGGNHNNYITDGKFELINGHIPGTKWAKAMDLYNTAAIKKAVEDGVADDTVVGCSMIDEPQHVSWGGVFTKPLLDEMTRYVKAIFPTLPVGVLAQVDWRPTEPYQDLDFQLFQYSARRGSVHTYRDTVLAQAAANGIRASFTMNILNGGYRTLNCPMTGADGVRTGGLGTSNAPPNCRMSDADVIAFGAVLLAAGPGLFMWEYEEEFMARSDNKIAFAQLRNLALALTKKSWRRP